MEQIMSFLTSLDWKQLIIGILAILGGASVISKITPWEWDNKIVNAIQKVINMFGLTKYE